MFKTSGPSTIPAHIDLDMVRETLLYLHSDCHDYKALRGIAAALEVAIEEIDRLETASAAKPAGQVIVACHFEPAGL